MWVYLEINCLSPLHRIVCFAAEWLGEHCADGADEGADGAGAGGGGGSVDSVDGYIHNQYDYWLTEACHSNYDLLILFD